MLASIVRCIIIYFIALIVVRVMGKRQIAQMQPFDVVITLIIADLATIPMSDPSIPLLNGIVPLLVLTVIHFFITLLSCKSLRMRKVLNGKPVILVGPDGIYEENIKSLNMTIADIMETCRYAGYLSISEVEYVIIETNGNISVIEKSEEKNAQPTPLPTTLISDGKISKENLKYQKITMQKLFNFLHENQTNLQNVILLQYSEDGEIFLQTKTQGVKNLNEKLGETNER